MEKAPKINSENPALDSDFEFFDPLHQNIHPDNIGKNIPRTQPNKLKSRDRAFYARMGALALAAAIVVAPAATKNHAKNATSTEVESPDFAPDEAFSPRVDVVNTSPAMALIDAMKQINESEPIAMSETGEEAEITSIEEKDPQTVLFTPPLEEEIREFTSVAGVNQPATTVNQPATAIRQSAAGADQTTKKTHETLNAHDGRVNGPSGEETFYNLPMSGVVERMHRMGYEGDYWVREDGAKMLGDYVIVAANLQTHPRGSIVETSLGPGIVCDTGAFAADHPHRLDLATDW